MWSKRKSGQGYYTEIDGVKLKRSVEFIRIDYMLEKILNDTPYSAENSGVIVYHNEVHMLGGTESSTLTDKHYKWNGKTWTKLSNIPTRKASFSVVIYKDEIHILGGYFYEHHKWNGSAWVEVSTLPYQLYNGSAVVYNDEIHIMGGDYDPSDAHYKWDGAEWSKVSNLPYKYQRSQDTAQVLNGEIHLLGGFGSSKSPYSHYKWDGSKWTSVSTIPYNFYEGGSVCFGKDIYILGRTKERYKWDGTEWTPIPNQYRTSPNYPKMVVFNDIIHIFETTYGNNTQLLTKYYKEV